MPLQDLSLVTNALKTLIREHLDDRFDTVVTTSAAAPDPNLSGTNTVNIYLFHVIEDPHYKNAAAPFVRGGFPVRQTPLALTLNYVITALTDLADEDGSALTQQRLLGFIAKTLHDFPVLTDDTEVGDPAVRVFDDALIGRDNRIELILRPATIQDTIGFWSAQQERLTRLSLYVEARVVLLDPEAAEQAAGLVLRVGNFVYAGAAPELKQSRSVMTFTPPIENPMPQQVRFAPARVALFGDPPDPAVPPDNDLLTLEASGLSPGRRFLMLRREGFLARVDLDLPFDDQTAENQAWAFNFTPAGLTLRVRRRLFDLIANTTVQLVPGTYGARIVLEDDRLGDVMPRSSNEIAFSVVPQILAVASAGVNTYDVSIVSDYLSNGALEIEVSVGKRFLSRTSSAPGPGEFQITSGSTLRLVRPDPLFGEAPEPLPLPIRLVVNGATATPAWITV